MARVSDVSEQSPPSPAEGEDSPSDAFHEAAAHLREIKAYALYYISTKLDAVRVSVRRAVVYAIVGAIAGVAGITLIVMAVVLAMQGLAELINWALHFAYAGLSPWIGPLIVGLGLLAALGIGLRVLVPRQFKAWHRQLVRKYEHKRRQQRVNVGCDVHQRAAGR